MSQLKTILLCADDFGLNSEVSKSILKLIDQERISATSCMMNMLDLEHSAQELVAMHDRVQIGLHFNLTEGFLVSEPKRLCFSLNELLLKTHLGLISSDFIKQEFIAQIEAFHRVMGCLPDFIDGHQHVHQFPTIRRVLVEAYNQEFKTQDIYFRTTYPSVSVAQYQLKTKILDWSGGKSFQKLLSIANISHNYYFSGVYDFNPKTNYRNLFRHWLRLAKNNTLIMCHPANGINEGDPIGAARVQEFEYLSSEEFIKDCREFNCQIKR